MPISPTEYRLRSVDAIPITRILHLIPSLDGGAGCGVLEILRRQLADNRFEPRVCVLGRRPRDVELNSNEPVDFLDAPVHERLTLWKRFSGLRALQRQWRPHLVHSHLWPAALTAGTILPASMPHLIHVRDTPDSLAGNRLSDRIRRWSLQRIMARPAVRLAAVSETAATYTANALQVDRGRITTIINGVDLSRFQQVPALTLQRSSPFVIACAGRLIPDKGFGHLIRAVARMKSREQVVLRIAGTGSAESSLRQLSQSLHLASQVAGNVTDMPAFFAAADLFAHASVKEGMSRVLIEAMAAGRPVVTCEHPGVEELVIDGVTGWIVPPQEVALAQCLDECVDDRSLLIRMGEAARFRALESFSADRVAQQVSDLSLAMLALHRNIRVEVLSP